MNDGDDARRHALAWPHVRYPLARFISNTRLPSASCDRLVLVSGVRSR